MFDKAQQRREKKCQDDEREKTAQLFRSMAGMRWTVPSQDQVDPHSGPLIHCPQVPIFYSGGPGYEFGIQKPFGGCQSLLPLPPYWRPPYPGIPPSFERDSQGSGTRSCSNPWPRLSSAPGKKQATCQLNAGRGFIFLFFHPSLFLFCSDT